MQSPMPAGRMFPPGEAPTQPLTFDDLFELYYEKFMVPDDNTGVGPEDSLKALKIIDEAYRTARPMKGGF